MDIVNGGAPVGTAGGVCYVCKHFSNPKVWVRTGCDIPYEGELVVCGDCARTIGHAVGLLPADAVTKLKDSNTALHKKNRELASKASAFDAINAALKAQAEA